MADSVRNILLEVAGKSDEAQRALENIAEELRELPDLTTLEVRAEVDEARRNLREMVAELRRVDRSEASPEVNVRITEALVDLEAFDRRLEAIDGEVARAVVDVDIRRDRLQQQIAAVRDDIERLGETHGLKRLDAQIAQANARLETAQRRLQAFRQIPGFDPTKLQEFMAAVDLAQKKVEELTARRRVAEIDVQAKTVAAEAALARLTAEVAALPDRKEIEIEISRGVLGDIADIDRGVTNMVRGLDRASQPARTFGDVLGNVVQSVKSVTPVLNGMSILIGVKLVAGLLAAGAAFVSAAGGVGVLATALIAALGPAVILAISVVVRLARVLNALKLQDAARDAAARKSAQGTAAAAAASEARRAAENGLRDAMQGVTTAERNLASAREAAAARIVQAQRRVADASREVGDASREVEQATVDAYRAIEDAAERASDAIRGVAQAELGVDRAKLSLEDAQAALDAYIGALDTAGRVSRDFRKFTDVAFDFSFDALAAATPDVEAGEQRRLADLILDVRQAKLDEAEATDRLSDSEREATDARKEHQRYQREGIAAYEPLRAAIRSQQDAQRNLNEATAEYNDLAADGVDKAPEVIAAAEAVRDANERLAEAKHRAATAGTEVGITDAQQRALEETNKLTDAERRFLEVLKQVRGELRTGIGPATDAVFGAMGRAIGRLPRLLNPLSGGFRKIGEAIASVVDNISTFVIQPNNIASFQRLFDASARVVEILGNDVFLNFFRIIINIANLAMPALIEQLQRLGDYLGGVADQTEDVAKVKPVIDAMTDSFAAFARLGGAVIDVLVAIAQSAGPIGNELVGSLTDALHSLAAFLRSTEGQEKIKDFFEDTLPSVKALIKSLVLLARIGLRLFQFFSPFLEGFLTGINLLLGAVDKFLALLNGIVSNPIGRWVRVFIGSFLGIGSVLRIIGRLGKLLQRLPGSMSHIGRSVLRYLTKPFADAGRFIIGLLARLPGRAGAIASTIPAAIVRGIRTRLSVFLSVGALIVGRIVSAIRGSLGALLAIGRPIVTKIADAVRSVRNLLVGVGALLLTGLIDGFTKLPGNVLAKIVGVGKKIVGALKNFLGIRSPSRVTEEIGRDMSRGLERGFTGRSLSAIVDKTREVLDKVAESETELAKAQRDAERAQRSLTSARRDARRELSDFASAAANAELGRRGAVFDLQDARRELAELRRRGAAQADIERAELRVDEARQRVRDATREATRAEQDNTAAQEKGLRGNQSYVAALDARRRALEKVAAEEKKLREETESSPVSQSTTLVPHPASLAIAAIRGELNGVIGWIGKLPGRFASAAKTAFTGISEGAEDAGQAVSRAASALVQTAIDKVGSYLGTMRDKGVALGRAMAEGVRDGFKALVGFGATIVNLLIDVINKGLTAINEFIPDKVKIKGLPDVNLPDDPLPTIPRLAHGGVVSAGTLFEAGEGRSDEAVLPLTRHVLRQLAEAIMGQLGTFPMAPAVASGARGALTRPVVSGGPRQVIEKLQPIINTPAGEIPDARVTANRINDLVARVGGGIPYQP